MKNPATAEGVEQREDEASVDPRKRVVFREPIFPLTDDLILMVPDLHHPLFGKAYRVIP